MLDRETGSDVSGSWFLPSDTGETLPETEATYTDVDTESAGTGSTSTEISSGSSTTTYVTEDTGLSSLAEQISGLQAQKNTAPYFYLPQSDSWISYSTLIGYIKDGESTGISVTEVCTYNTDVDLDFLEAETPVMQNGAADILQCVAIEQIRNQRPTAFSNITYGIVSIYGDYLYEVDGINLADAIFEEIYEVDGVRYHLYAEMDKPDIILMVCYEIL